MTTIVATPITGIEPAIRTSRIFMNDKGRWRQAHHHGSFKNPAMPDRYQRAVRGMSD